MKSFFTAINCLLVIFLHTGKAYAQEDPQTLTIFNWQYYLSEPVIDLWEQETNVKIKQIYFDSDTDRDRIINQLQGNEVDIAVLDEVATRNFTRNNKLLDLTTTDSLTNLSYVPKIWKNQCSSNAVPYFWGTLGLIYRKDIYPIPPNTWRALLYPQSYSKNMQQRNIGMLADYSDMLMPSLFLRGLSIHESNKEDLTQVYAELQQQIPFVRTYEYILTYLMHNPQEMANIHLALAYSGDTQVLNHLGSHYQWGYTVPKEGTVLWVDCLAVLKSSKKPQLALSFINFLHRPNIAAINARELGNSTTNSKAITLLEAEGDHSQSLYPDMSIIQRSQFYSTQDNASMTLRSRIRNAIIKEHSSQIE
ncbi:spermidine/putrescine ABC transporter substrate-binding protein [Vibrio genomosp. F6]|uniref:ABC transporter substrate-binding protein n=1 Tax=Vibrio genomosp. F6 TaxID=723172 RepID=UPI000DE95FCD|nr:spermidine/putrescine ABC transporter substrate-binding protein [Vibrio genomosp. F6]RBW63862.1 hypothetical protein DS893_16420 [Vibrionales bacterium C3R12]TKF23270.1 spermidine/putrescine ABC transporter substrate-binding protein [Vibrio genomosp. F6]